MAADSTNILPSARAVVAGRGPIAVAFAVALERAGCVVSLVGATRTAFAGLPAGSRARLTIGDAADPALLLRAGADLAQVLVAVGEPDERNVAVALVAHRLLGTRIAAAGVGTSVHAAACGPLGIEAVLASEAEASAFPARVGALLRP
ncbi:MAG: NAD-binding protein [Planctomycetes bacterium]|nr:NAD-binding protein [Planctomycetota bacterium]